MFIVSFNVTISPSFDILGVVNRSEVTARALRTLCTVDLPGVAVRAYLLMLESDNRTIIYIALDLVLNLCYINWLVSTTKYWWVRVRVRVRLCTFYPSTFPFVSFLIGLVSDVLVVDRTRKYKSIHVSNTFKNVVVEKLLLPKKMSKTHFILHMKAKKSLLEKSCNDGCLIVIIVR